MACACVAGCTARPALPTAERATREFSAPLELHGARLTLHFAMPLRAQPGTPLVLYASGDGGWFGAAVGMFRAIANAGFPVVGFSSRAFLKIEQRSDTAITAPHVADDYEQVLGIARKTLGLPPTSPALITGWSRGAALGVLVASGPGIDPGVTGVVAIGLAEDERLDIEPGGDDDPEPGIDLAVPVSQGKPGAHAIEMYRLIGQVAPRRCVVVQASKDKYLPAARARLLLGPDSDMKRLITVEAKNHRFGGAEAAFQQALIEAMEWASRAHAPGREGQ